MPRVGTVDERFQSYNVEMIEVTGGWFWRPYADSGRPPSAQGPAVPQGVDPSRYAYRPPIDLADPRLRRLAAALGPAYVRVSGTWANATYFHDADGPPPAAPPPGFKGVLTRPQWRGVVDFARAVDADIVTSFAISPGARDARGLWSPRQALALIDYTRALGGRIAAAEFMNEPNLPAISSAPDGYDAAAFGRDVAVFRSLLGQAAPGTVLVGPASAGEALTRGSAAGAMSSERLLAAAGRVFEAFSYHYYPTLSERCGTPAPEAVARERALSEPWLAATERVAAFYAGLRDDFAPGAPLWITETAEAACGGNRWATTFLDSFRYLDQLGRLARRGVQVVMHNTLAASDYGLLDEATLQPRPNYWAALLWRKLMGTVVLDPGPSPAPSLHFYAHCLRDRSGGVALLAINTDSAATPSIDVPVDAERYTLGAGNVTDRRVQLNGVELGLGADGALPALQGVAAAGRVGFAPGSITFLAFSSAGNPACR